MCNELIGRIEFCNCDLLWRKTSLYCLGKTQQSVRSWTDYSDLRKSGLEAFRNIADFLVDGWSNHGLHSHKPAKAFQDQIHGALAVEDPVLLNGTETQGFCHGL